MPMAWTPEPMKLSAPPKEQQRKSVELPVRLQQRLTVVGKLPGALPGAPETAPANMSEFAGLSPDSSDDDLLDNSSKCEQPQETTCLATAVGDGDSQEEAMKPTTRCDKDVSRFRVSDVVTASSAPMAIAKRSREHVSFALWLLRKLVHWTPYHLFCSFIIVLNAFFVGYAAELELHRKHMQLLGEPDAADLRGTFRLMDFVFCGWFIVELVLNFSANPRAFIFGESRNWNIFDTALVAWCILESLLEGTVTKMSHVRTLRVFRTARVLRVMRVFKVFTSLRLMVFAIIQSMTSLIWVFLLLLLLMYVFSVGFLNASDTHISMLLEAPEFSTQDRVAVAELMRLYGGVSTSCATLFQAISGGNDWMDLVAPLEALSPAYRYVFSFFIFFTVFGVLNVVTGAFVDNFHIVSQRDRDVVIQDEIKREKKYIRDVKAIFDGADEDHSGMLSLEEFEHHLMDTRVKAFFSTLELDVSHAKALFQLLDTDGTNEVGIDEFVSGCMRLKGNAKSMDVNMLLYESEFMMSRMCENMTQISDKLTSIEGRVLQNMTHISDIRGSRAVHSEKAVRVKVADQDSSSRASPAWRPGAMGRARDTVQVLKEMHGLGLHGLGSEDDPEEGCKDDLE